MPQGFQPDAFQYQATLIVPNSWRYGTALPIQRESGNQIEFQPASLTTLVDSPVSAGAHYRTFELGGEQGAAHYLHVATDSDRALGRASPEGRRTNTGTWWWRRAPRSARGITAAITFLFTPSDHVAHFGLEHHESSDDRLRASAP